MSDWIGHHDRRHFGDGATTQETTMTANQMPNQMPSAYAAGASPPGPLPLVPMHGMPELIEASTLRAHALNAAIGIAGTGQGSGDGHAIVENAKAFHLFLSGGNDATALAPEMAELPDRVAALNARVTNLEAGNHGSTARAFAADGRGQELLPGSAGAQPYVAPNSPQSVNAGIRNAGAPFAAHSSDPNVANTDAINAARAADPTAPRPVVFPSAE